MADNNSTTRTRRAFLKLFPGLAAASAAPSLAAQALHSPPTACATEALGEPRTTFRGGMICRLTGIASGPVRWIDGQEIDDAGLFNGRLVRISDFPSNETEDGFISVDAGWLNDEGFLGGFAVHRSQLAPTGLTAAAGQTVTESVRYGEGGKATMSLRVE